MTNIRSEKKRNNERARERVVYLAKTITLGAGFARLLRFYTIPPDRRRRSRRKYERYQLS